MRQGTDVITFDPDFRPDGGAKSRRVDERGGQGCERDTRKIVPWESPAGHVRCTAPRYEGEAPPGFLDVGRPVGRSGDILAELPFGQVGALVQYVRYTLTPTEARYWAGVR